MKNKKGFSISRGVLAIAHNGSAMRWRGLEAQKYQTAKN